jgi:hypothetical protein
MVWMELNIGFPDNPFTVSDIIKLLDNTFPTDSLTRYRKTVSEWEGKTEATLVARLNTYDDLHTIVSKLSILAKVMNQSCIAVKAESFELLVYQTPFPESKKVKFDNKYFIDYHKVEVEA